MNTGIPSCSVIVPTHRRARQLGECLQALADLDYPPERYEVLVVDDGGGVPLNGIIDRVRRRISVTLVEQARAGPAAARNAGAQRAGGSLLAFTDDDCRPRRNWLRSLGAAFAERPERGLGGRTINGLPDNPFAATSELVIAVGYAQNDQGPDSAGFFASNNLALPRDGFRALGGFDPAFRTSEDRDLCSRWRAAGLPLAYCPEALVEHRHDLTLGGFWRQHLAYGRGAYRYHRAEARRHGRVRLEPSFYAALARSAVRDGPPVGAPRRLALLGVWGLANAVGFSREALGR